MDLEALEALEYLATKALQPLPPNQDQPFLSTILFQDFCGFEAVVLQVSSWFVLASHWQCESQTLYLTSEDATAEGGLWQQAQATAVGTEAAAPAWRGRLVTQMYCEQSSWFKSISAQGSFQPVGTGQRYVIFVTHFAW